MYQYILASASPRRKELLEQLGLEFQIWPARGEEIITKELPQEVVVELSAQKAQEIGGKILTYNENHADLVTPQDMIIIGADTVVACDDRILGKPADEADAKRMLSLLSGRTHQVYTGVTLLFIDAQGRCGTYSFYEKTEVTMYQISEEEIDWYVSTGEPMDKAGAYGIQGKCAAFIEKITGDYYNVVGLPIPRLYQELKKLGIKIHG